ncbi:MAG: hypothetical protein AAGC77_13855, partial [Pseudomonadota bacterium]
MDINFKRLCAFICAISTLIAASLRAEDNEISEIKSDKDEAIYIIYDSSGSMWGELADSARKYEAGRSALTTFLDTDLSGREVAFRAYGHRRKADCRDTELIVPFSEPAQAKQQIADAANGIRPTGKTPITHSLRQALTDLDGRKGDILLVSDGIETCDIDPCELMREWRTSNVDIRVFVVGVGLTSGERSAMSCIAETSGGKYFDADSAEGFSEALNDAGAAIESPGDPEPVDEVQGYALKIIATDDDGRRFIATGDLYKDGVDIGDVSSNDRNVLDGPGDYEIEIGAVVADGSTYKPVKHAFTVSERGEHVVEVVIVRPALVRATFLENGEDQPGSFVTAFKDGEEAFGFRAFDEALAQPGVYEFRASPNADNSLSLTEALIEGEATELIFELNKTIGFYVEFVLPNGDTFRRGSELWRNGEKLYSVFGSRNATTIIPGRYELRADDQNLPLTPLEVDLTEDGKTYQIPIEAGWVKITYGPPEFNYVNDKPATSATIESLERGSSTFARADTEIPVKPGQYKVNPRTDKGFMEPIEVNVPNGETIE